MAGIHLNRQLLQAVAEGSLPPRELVNRGWQHLLDLCPTCREELATWRRWSRRHTDYGPIFQSIRETLSLRGPQIEVEQRRAEEDLAAVLCLEPADRRRRIQRARTRFRGRLMAQLLMDEARTRLPGDIQGARELFDLAEVVLRRSGEPSAFPDLWARLRAHQGNAVRVLPGDLCRADELLGEARALLQRHEVADPLIRAEVLSLEGSLRRDQRRFHDAEAVLSSAVVLYRGAEESVQAARTLIKLGTVYYHSAEPERAVEVVRQARAVLDPELHPRLFWSTCHNLAFYLCDCDRAAEAREILTAHRSLYRRFPDAWTQLRLRWLEGKIAAGLGEDEAAEEALLAARSSLVEEGYGYDAALVSLEAALLFARQGRADALKRLAEEMWPLFQGRMVHREALSVLLLFRGAAESESLTVATVRELVTLLQRNRRTAGAVPW